MEIHVGLILLASLFDYLDGFAARKLNVQSALGTQLDSFADLVTFGIAPAVIVYFVSTLSLFFVENGIEFWLFLILGFVPLLGAIRLARFNTVEEESSFFIGLPIPAFALITISLTWTYLEYTVEPLLKSARSARKASAEAGSLNRSLPASALG